jgi:hypothetical protein
MKKKLEYANYKINDEIDVFNTYFLLKLFSETNITDFFVVLKIFFPIFWLL